MPKVFSVFAFLLLTTILIASSPTYLKITGPVSSTIYNGMNISLGKVGPGESFYVMASASTANASGVPVNIGWNLLKASEVPAGWSSQQSTLYENPMKLKVTVSPDAQYGTYKMVLKAININNYSGLGNLTFTVFINVTPNVFNLKINPQNVSVGTGQPANFQVTINNTGASDDPFIINAYGLPSWNVSDEVIALHSKTSTFTYPVYVDEPGVYSFNITVSSASSFLISKSYRIHFISKATLLNDYKAIGKGVVLSPIIFEPEYAFMLFLSYLYNAITSL